MTDSIDTVVTIEKAVDVFDNTPFKIFDIGLIINGVNYHVKVAASQIFAVKRSCKAEIFTCSCGVAGCAGIFEMVEVKVRKHTIEWRLPVDSGYGFLPKRFYSFSRKEYLAMLEETRQELVELSQQTNPVIHIQFAMSESDDCQLKYNLKQYQLKEQYSWYH
jgi:Zn-finger domain-containing protein